MDGRLTQRTVNQSSNVQTADEIASCKFEPENTEHTPEIYLERNRNYSTGLLMHCAGPTKSSSEREQTNDHTIVNTTLKQNEIV